MTIRIERVRQESSNPLRRFLLISDGKTQARIIAKWAEVCPDNNEGLTEYLHYLSFNSDCARRSLFLRCPRPLAFLETYNVLLTEECAGTPLSEAFKSLSGTLSDSELRRGVQHSGEWLSSFHEYYPSMVIPIKETWPTITRSCPWIVECLNWTVLDRRRFCPSCGYRATLLWLEKQEAALPDIPYAGVVFTMPRELWSILGSRAVSCAPKQGC